MQIHLFRGNYAEHLINACRASNYQEIKKTLFSIGFWRFWALNVLLNFLLGHEKVQEKVQASLNFFSCPALGQEKVQASLNFFSCPAQEIKKTLFSIGFWRFWALNVLLSFLIGQEKVQENVQASLNFFAARWWCMNWLDALHTLWIHV